MRMRSLVLGSWSTGGRWCRRNGRARGQIAAAGPRERWFCRCNVVYGSDDVCVVEIAMQVGAGMQTGTAGLLDKFGACLDEKTKSELTGGMCGAAVLGHNGRMDALHCTVDGCDVVRCGAQRARRDETRDSPARRDRHTRHTRHTRRWRQAGQHGTASESLHPSTGPSTGLRENV